MDRPVPKYTREERYRLSNQLRILEALYPDEADEFAVTREIIERGYEMMYSWHLDNIYDGDDAMSVDECTEVWDTLEMFGEIARTLDQNPQIKPDENRFTKFAGYDGNNESKFLSFAQFTVERLNRFEYVPLLKPKYWNSHFPVRDVYRRMLEVYLNLPMQRRHSLSSEDLNAVLIAAIHPERR